MVSHFSLEHVNVIYIIILISSSLLSLEFIQPDLISNQLVL